MQKFIKKLIKWFLIIFIMAPLTVIGIPVFFLKMSYDLGEAVWETLTEWLAK